MISSINSTNMQNLTVLQNQNSLTDEQKSSVEELLANYDSENLTEEDATEILDQLKEMEIRPSRELRETVENAGFSFDQLIETSGIAPTPPPEMASGDFEGSEMGGDMQVKGAGGPPPAGGMPPPSGSSSEDEDEQTIQEILAELLEEAEETEESTTASATSSDDETTVSAEVKDYATRIGFLNEESQTEVKDLLDRMKASEGKYSKEQVSNYVTNSLNSILSDESNFEHMEFVG